MEQKPGTDLSTDDDAQFRDLVRAIASLQNEEEATAFLRDLCTVQELQALGSRWLVARLLDRGMHYSAVAEQTGASPTTISRVNTWLRYGRGGYRMMLARWSERGW